MTPSMDNYLAHARDIIDAVAEQRTSIAAAADLITEAVRAGGVLHCFGTGHSRIVAHELAGRAGGLAFVNQIAVKDLVMFGGAAPESILDPTCERDPRLAASILALADIRPADIFLIISNSGVNGTIVEFAQRVRDAGHRVVAITSLRHTSAVASRHPGGKRLVDLADVVIDNNAPLGDAMFELPGGDRCGAVSSVSGVLIVQSLQAEIVARLIKAGEPVPVLTSQNTSGGDDRNLPLYQQYAGRVRPIEP